MTGTGTRFESKKRIAIISAISLTLIALITVLGIWLSGYLKDKDLENELRDYQSEMLEILQSREGEYDERSIVLSETNISTARQLAEKLGAELRITKDGSFAKLTLPADMSIIDVCSNDDYLEDIPRMSIDYHVRVSEVYEENNEFDDLVTSRPDYDATDASYDLQTYLDYINMQNIWDITTGSGVTVAIIDTGIDTDHPEFTGRISEYSYNATEDKIVKDYVLENGSYDWSLIEDEQGHGTAVAGVIAASMNDGEIVGIAPMVEILVIKAECGEDGSFKNATDLVFGLYYAVERDVSVVNMSFGMEVEDEKYNIFKEPALLAKDSDIICVASAGNNATAALTYPAADVNVFGVGALAEDSWELAGYSNYGENVNLVAPGTTYTSIKGGKYGTMSGTSMSAPIVAGSIALYLAQNRYQEFITVEEVLYASCRDLGDLGSDWYYGYGALDVSAFIIEERGKVTFNMLSDELENTEQIFIRNHTLQNMPEPERLYAVFDGWYYDPQCTEEYNWYTDKFSSDLTLYAGWVNEEDGIPYTYVELEDGTIEIRSYTGKRRYITIPDYIEDKVVSSIGRGAFAGNTRIRQVNLPKYLVNINDLAFEGCSNLVSMTIPDTVVKIGNHAFYDNMRLSSVTFGSNSRLETIGEEAFSGCVKLRSFMIPASVTDIAESAFYRSTSILSFDVHNGNQYYTSVDGSLCNKDATRLICYPYGRTGMAIIPESVNTLGTYSFRYAKLQGIESWGSAAIIEEYAFEHSSIKGTLSIPDQITDMGEGAFAQNYYILKLEFGTGLNEIPDSAFFECSSLRSISFSDSIEVIGGSAFRRCVMFPEVYIPANVQYIRGKAFGECYQLKSLTFAEDAKLKEIGEFAFSSTSIEKVDFPASLEIIGGAAFYITPVYSVTFADGSVLREIGASAFRGTGIREIIFPETLEYLGGYSFSGTPISEVIIPANVSNFGGGAFAGCYNLAAIEVVEDNPYYNDIDGVVYTENGDMIVAYPSGNKNLSYDILSGIKSVGPSSFAGSVYLENVVIPDGNEVIKESAFDSSSVVNVHVGDGLTTIETWAFILADRLTTINLPEGLTTVGIEIFYGTDSLIELVIPESLSILTESSFAGCGARRYVLPESLTEIQTKALAYNKNLQSLHIPDNVVQIGKYAFYNNYSMHSVTFTENTKLPRISYGAFAYCGLTSFRVPANVSTIAQGAFEGCDQLRSFTFAANSKLPSISAYMFDGCDNLNIITFEQGSALTSIQAHGLEGMRKLTTVDFGDAKLTNIDNFAFRFCESLTEIRLPEGVTNIGRFAFYDCTALTDVSLPSTLEHIGRFAFLGADNVNLYFASETLPQYLDEDWDYGIEGYYLGVEEVKEEGDWRYAVLTGGGIALIEYKGNETTLDLNSLDFGGEIVNIGGECFSYTEIESVTLPDTLVTIQAKAFYHSKLKSITIPKSVEFIGRSAFGDTPITSLIFEEDSCITVIEQSAFEGTSQLTGVDLPASITTLGRAVFKNSGIAYVNFADGILITEIPEEAFAYTNITTVKIPDSVSLINHNAFRETANLRSVEFGSAEEIMIMSNVFYLSGLETVRIPANVTYIGEYAFVALKNLTAFEVDENNPYYTEIDGVLVGSGGRKLIAMPAGREGSYTVPINIEMIGFGAFEETALSEVKFLENSNILTLGYRAFYKAENITSMHIPASVISIDFYAFANCINLESVTFAENSGLTGIYEGAFYGCNNLSDIILPDSIIEISDFAFYGCNKLTRIPVSETSQLKGVFDYAMAYTGLTGEFTAPETLIDIGEYAFMGTKITKITIPDTNAWDLVIGIGAFEDCRNVTEITLPFVGASFEDPDIGWFGYIFGAGAYEANNVYVPEGLKKITVTGDITELGEGAFYNLSKITELNLPDSIAILGNNSFSGFTGKYTLTGPILGRGYNWYGYPEYTINSSTFGKGIYGHIILDEGIAGIPHGTFWDCTGITEVTIPDSATYIDGWAFYGCSGLETVNIGSGVKDIDSNAFLNCNVQNINISEDNPHLQIIDGIIYDNPVTKIICVTKNLPSKVVIPEGVTNIPSYAFESSTVSEIVLPNSLKTISNDAFRCVNMTSITLGTGLESIGDGAFYGLEKLYLIRNNSSLNLTIGSSDNGWIAAYAQIIILANGDEVFADSSTKIEIIGTEDGFRFFKEGDKYYLVAYLGDEKFITLPESINGSTYIVESFSSSAEEICISNGASEVKSNAFDSCGSLRKFAVTEDNAKYGVFDGILYSNDFSKLISVPQKIEGTVTIPGSVKVVPNHSFALRNGITNVILSNGVHSIESYAFYHCYNIEKIDLPDTLIHIGDHAFDSCASLKEIDIPDSIAEISPCCFYDCTSLESVKLSKNLESIGMFAFTDCHSLRNVKAYDGLQNIQTHAFLRCSEYLIIELPASVTHIDSGAFDVTASLIFPEDIVYSDGIAYSKSQEKIIYISVHSTGKVIIPYGITSIPSFAFSYCNFTEIVIPESVTDIGEYAFQGCGNLKKATLPSQITEIRSGTFSSCTALTEILIPEGVKTIADYSFFNCSSLKNIVLPQSIGEIGEYAFSNCTSLESIHLSKNIKSCQRSAFDNCPQLSISMDEEFDLWKNIDGIWYNSDETEIMYLPTDIRGEITILDGIADIATAISYHPYITKIYLPDSMTGYLNDAYFSGCLSLTEIIVSETHPTYSSVNGVLYNKDKTELIAIPAGYNQTLVIEEGVTSIGGIFSGINEISSIVLPSTLQRIEEFCMLNLGIDIIYNNSSLQLSFGEMSKNGGIAYTAKVIVEKDGTRRYANGVEDYDIFTTEDGFQWKKENGEYYLTGYVGSEDTVTLPNSINGTEYKLYGFIGASHVIIPEGWTEIPEYAFSESGSLQSISIPETVKVIGERAFYGCYNLKSITLHEGIERIESSGFNGCRGLTEVEFPSTLSYIGAGAFRGCSFESITIPATIKKFGGDVFGNCKILKDVILEDGLTQLPGFSYCTALEEISIPDSVTDIGDFTGCSGLTEIIIPNGVKSIGYHAFYDCTSLSTIIVGDNITSIGEEAFYNTAYYNNTDNWYQGVLYLHKYLIRVSEDVKYFDLKEEVKCVAEGAYKDCYKLKIAYVSGTQYSALESATNIETLVIVGEMPNRLFYYFGYSISGMPITLKNVVISKDVKMVNYAFGNEWESWITGLNIFVEDTEKDTMWDENYPYWQKGNRVHYGDKWIYSKFHGEDGQLLTKNLILNSQIIRLPWTDNYYDDTYAYLFQGYDINGDGIADSVPATSTIDITANAVYDIVHRCDLGDHRIIVIDKSVAPTCTETGLAEGKHCSVCNKVLVVQEVIDALGHLFAHYTFNNDATCTDNGTETAKCDRCDEIDTRIAVDSAIGHIYGIEVVENNVDPSCTADGSYDNVVYCSECSVELSREKIIVEAIGHSYGSWYDVTAPNCTEDGLERRDCAKCDAFETNVLSKLGHSYDYVTTDPTCTNHGYTTYICHCGDSYVDAYVDALGHTESDIVVENEVDPTCAVDGSYDNVVYCTVCGEELSRETITIDALGHDYQTTWSSNSTSHWYECSCGEKRNVEKHVFDNACDVDCNKCGFTRSTKHSFDQGVITKEPTTTEEGRKTYTCTVCGEKKYEDIDKLDEPDQEPSGGCYIATSVYGSYDCPEVWTLRRFRDNVLAKTWLGRAFVKTYYAVSPTLVEWFGDTNWFQNIWRAVLDVFVDILNGFGFENTPYHDQKW